MANSITTLLAARAVQGAGAALIVPQILATLHITLKGTAHARAISLYGGIGGIAFIVGQMGGGWLVSADIAGLGWRNAFFINVPICLLVLASVHNTSRRPGAKRIHVSTGRVPSASR
jgi:MFS family permease